MSSPSKVILLIVLWISITCFSIIKETSGFNFENQISLTDTFNGLLQTVTPSSEENDKDLSKSEKLKKEIIDNDLLSSTNKIVENEKIIISKEENNNDTSIITNNIKEDMTKNVNKKVDEITTKNLDLEKKIEIKPDVQKLSIEVSKKINTKNEEIKVLENKTSDVKIIQDEINAIVKTGKIVFKRLGTDVTLKSETTIEKIAQVLKTNNKIIEVSGHTDAKGEEEFNLYISQKRAKSVRLKLISFGIDASRVKAKGYGESKPLVKNNKDGYSSINRRVEFNIIKE